VQDGQERETGSGKHGPPLFIPVSLRAREAGPGQAHSGRNTNSLIVYTFRVIAGALLPIDHFSDTMAQPCLNATETLMPSRSVPSEKRSRLALELSRVKGQMEPGQICAYNQTRECFLGLQVVAGDLSRASLVERTASLTPDSGAGIRMVPFRGIPAAEVRTPLDLLYLDENCHIIDAVEFFPTNRVSPSSPPAASVLALPVHTIFATRTKPGDLLILCAAEEMEWRLEQLACPETVGISGPSARPGTALRPVLVGKEPKQPAEPSLANEKSAGTIDTVPVREERNAAAVLPAAPLPPAHEPASPQTPQPHAEPAKPWMEPARHPAKPPLGKLGRWLFPDPPDPRKTSRQPVAGLVAHFFTGGSPKAHEIRDVSPTGLYVVTAERWYPGTVIRMTLSKPDSGENPADRSITVQAKSVRWGNDGVGLEFVLEAPHKPNRNVPSPLDSVDRDRLNYFLKHSGIATKSARR
jgi:hypothetical protein